MFFKDKKESFILIKKDNLIYFCKDNLLSITIKTNEMLYELYYANEQDRAEDYKELKNILRRKTNERI